MSVIARFAVREPLERLRKAVAQLIWWHPSSATSSSSAAEHMVRELACMVGRMRVGREPLAAMLRQHGEDDLADRALSLSDDELARIRTLGNHYAFSEDAMALGGSMGGARALSLATIDVLENTGRDLCWSRTERELEGSSLESFAEHDVARDRELRRHAAERQVPADESKRTLDAVDPPVRANLIVTFHETMQLGVAPS
jgi:hypothetical protein